MTTYTQPIDTHDASLPSFSEEAVIDSLKQRGFCILRNLFAPATLKTVNERLTQYYSRPSVAGVPGYYKVDYPKKLLTPGLIGPSVYPLMLNEKIISIVEKMMESECVLAEAFFKYDY